MCVCVMSRVLSAFQRASGSFQVYQDDIRMCHKGFLRIVEFWFGVSGFRIHG